MTVVFKTLAKALGAFLAATVLAAFNACAQSAHYAVCVGINEYDEGFVSRSNWLRGCVPDACNIWTNITERGEWTPETSAVLLDSAATKDAIRAAISGAAAAAQPGDVFLYAHSSHGGSNGGLNVYLCSYNARYEDSELAADLAQFKSGVKVVVMVDACNSGGLFKGMSVMRAAADSDDGGSAAPLDIAGRVGSLIDGIRARESRLRAFRAMGMSGISSSEIGWITAADYNQYSWDDKSGNGGIFTLAALNGWRSGLCDDQPCGNEDNYADFYELWNYAKGIAVGNGEPGTANYTEAQCANSNVLKSAVAGWIGDGQPSPEDPPRIREVGDFEIEVGKTVSFYIRAFAPTNAPATLAIAEGDESATLEDGWFSFTPTKSIDYEFVITAENAYGVAREVFTVAAYSVQMDAPVNLREAPFWSEIPVLSAQSGRFSIVDLAKFVHGTPAPKMELVEGNAALEGTLLSFTPTKTGHETFSVTASNEFGIATAEINVVVGELAPKKFAVCVGINEYADEYIPELMGCANDAKYMAANLVSRGGWDAADVTVLVDGDATKSAIRSAISNVAAQALPGDTFVYMHSSHGGQFYATGYDTLIGEDGKHTFICVYDEDLYDNATAYNDYEIAEDLAAFSSGIKVAVIVDACFSGGLFKSCEEAMDAAESFDLAGSVSSIIDDGRANRLSRGEDVSHSISSTEIGWGTACEYYELSRDGGFYHTDKWLADPIYGEEYWNYSAGRYLYPDNYRVGGAFLASATWSWWNGDADCDSDAGNNDGFCDAYEFWKKGYDFCSQIGEFWFWDSQYNYYPQCANEDVLRSIELGWSVPQELFGDLPDGATAEMVASKLAGCKDNAVLEHVTDVGVYSMFCSWAKSVKTPAVSKSDENAPAGARAVWDSSRAWLSFAFGSDTLLVSDISGDDVRIVRFEQGEDSVGLFYGIDVEIDGIAVGSSSEVSAGLVEENICQMFGVRGGSKLNSIKSVGDAWLQGLSAGRIRLGAPLPSKKSGSYFFQVTVDVD